MKKQCEYTRKTLKNYLRGHVYKLQKMRVERHLKSCVMCRSELESLKHAEEARRYIKDITPVEGIMPVLQEGVSAVKGLKKVLYRPLWIAGIVLIATTVTYYFVTPRKLDIEIDNIARTAPSGTVISASSPSAPVVNAVPAIAQAVHAPTAAPVSRGEPDRMVEPLAITITAPQEQEKESIQRINQVVRELGKLRKEAFSNEVREITGALTASELVIFISRISNTGRASYNRKRLDSFPGTQTVPFILTLKFAPRAASTSSPSIPPVQKPLIEPAPSAPPAPASAPPPGQ
jgi:hypothetical protein